MGFPKCEGCSWCCVFLDEKGKKERPILSREDKRRIKPRYGQVWDRDNRIKATPEGLCVMYELGRGCRLESAERPFDCLLYPFLRNRRGDFRIDPACPEIQRLLREMTRDNSAPLEKILDMVNHRAQPRRNQGAKIKRLKK